MMTQALNNADFAALGAPHLVYVRPVKAGDVMAGAPEAAIQAAFGQVRFSPEHTLYALHGADGARLAILAEKDSACAAALAHELALVSVH